MPDRTYLFVINSLDAGGVERSLVELLPRLAEDDVTPIVAVLNGGGRFETEAVRSGLRVRQLEGRGLIAKTLQLRRLLREVHPSVMYTALFDADLAGRFAAIGTDVPVLTNLANTTYDEARFADPNVGRLQLGLVRSIDGFTARHMTDHFHAVSQAVKDSAVRNIGIDPERVSVIPRGREPGRIGERSPDRRSRVRLELGVASDAFVVMTAGRQEFQKGHAILLRAIASLRAKHPEVILLIAGREGNVTSQLKTLIEDLDLGEAVSLLGHRDDVTDVMSASDLFVFPSLYEGLGGALIEAMAVGLPIVASDIPALREVVVDGENAILVPPGDAIALSAAIDDVMGDETRLAGFGHVSQTIFEEKYRAETATAAMASMLSQVARDDGDTDSGDVSLASTNAVALDPGFDTSLLERCVEVGTWSSPKARFVHLLDPMGEEIALKLGTNWTSRDARFVAEEVKRVGTLLADLPAGPVRMPRALAWSEDPPAVFLSFERGENLFDWLVAAADMEDPAIDVMAALVRRCGQAVGRYHSAQPAPQDDERGHRAATADLMHAARRAGVPRATMARLEPDLPRARGYRFSANDFTVDDTGRLLMHDPPHVEKFDYLHRDVSAFTYDLHRTLIGHRRFSRDHPRAEIALALRGEFLTGYGDTGPRMLDSPLDLWMVEFYETSRIVGRSIGVSRRRQFDEIPGQVRWALQARRELGSPPTVAVR